MTDIFHRAHLKKPASLRQQSVPEGHNEVHHADTDPCLSKSAGVNSLSRSIDVRPKYYSESDTTAIENRPISLCMGEGGKKAVVHRDHIPDHIKKVAICGLGATIFYELNQNRPLTAIVQDICDKWSLADIENFALQFSDQTRKTYITERNRFDIQNGNVLELTEAPDRAAQSIIDRLKGGSREEKIDALKNLSVKCSDLTFAQEFIKKNGLKLIIDYVKAGTKSFSGDPLMYLLQSFVALMEHNVVTWDTLDTDFIKQVAICISGTASVIDGCIQPSLEILESVILSSSDPGRMDMLEAYISPDKVIPYLKKNNVAIQESTLALLYAMFLKSSADKKQRIAECFQSKLFRQTVQHHILNSSDSMGPEMTHQLYKLQRVMLNMYEKKMKTGVSHGDTALISSINKQIEDLRKIAFDFADPADTSSGNNRKSAIAKDLKKLGFANQAEPFMDFEKTPPGLLALENMIYFAHFHKEDYIKVVLENCGRANEQDCPFVQASIKLTQILCDFLKIGESPYEDEHLFYPMFFNTERPVEEFFSYCIPLLNRTWKEMRASKEDFPKVLSVVGEQITRALDRTDRSLMPKTFDQFKTKLGHLAYPELKKIWDAERQKKDESKASARPIIELREVLKKDTIELIRKHRLNYLEGGSRFLKYDSKGSKSKGKYQYWRLAPNHRALHYGDCGENEEPKIEQLPNKIPISDIKELAVGKNSAPAKNQNRRMQYDLAFSIVLEDEPTNESSHYFVAESNEVFMIWTDGINALLNNKMTSGKTVIDLEVLLNMEVKLRLLETEGITIPEHPPPIPPLPKDFNFAYTVS